jgi:histidine triad (HIT) family protein
MSCIFCKIINNRTEDFVYEDDKVVVLVSKFQTSHGHLVATFKEHYENTNDISEDDYVHLQRIAKRYSDKLHKQFEPEKVYIVLLAEEVSHIHFHLIPRYKDDIKGPKFLLDGIKEVDDYKCIISKLTS